MNESSLRDDFEELQREFNHWWNWVAAIAVLLNELRRR
jgi:hypothetical protein